MADFDLLNGSPVRETWRKWWELFNELLAHALSIVFVIAVIEFIDWFITFSHGGPIVLFEHSILEFPLKYLFEAADVAMIVCISVVAVYTIATGARR